MESYRLSCDQHRVLKRQVFVGRTRYSNNRSREDRSYEYRSDREAACVHPTDAQEGVGECFGTVVRREASEHPVLSKEDVAKIAAAAAATLAATEEEHDGEKGSEEPFFDAFLTGAVRAHLLSRSRVFVRPCIVVPHYDATALSHRCDLNRCVQHRCQRKARTCLLCLRSKSSALPDKMSACGRCETPPECHSSGSSTRVCEKSIARAMGTFLRPQGHCHPPHRLRRRHRTVLSSVQLLVCRRGRRTLWSVSWISVVHLAALLNFYLTTRRAGKELV